MTDIIADMRSWLNGTPVPPYGEILERWGIQFMMYRDALQQNIYPWRGSIEGEMRQRVSLMQLRDQAIAEFCFSIPCAEILDTLANCQPILEVGAGTGYWTALMRRRNIDVVGTDSNDQGWWKSAGQYDPQQKTVAGKTAIKQWPGRTVFCSWPSYNATWFRQAMKAMQPKQRMVLIEEDACGEDTTWEYRDHHFEIEDHIPVPAWPGMNDRCGVWRKREPLNI